MTQAMNGPRLVRKLGALGAVGLLLGAAGCANTLSGAKQDATTDTQKAATAADQAAATAKTAADQAATTAKTDVQKAGAAVETVPQDAKAAAVITPEVKTAIIRDPVLNDPRNLVNVKSVGHTVHLTGHVADASMKTRATEDAQAVLSKSHADFQVSDELAVTSSGS